MEIRDVEKIKAFVFGGNALFTLSNEESGNRFTFKVKASRDGKFHFVNLLNGPDNTSDFAYIGCIPERKFFTGGKKSRVTPEAPSFKAFSWLFRQVSEGKALPDKVKFHHEGRCGRCGRVLTVPESIESGFGPECITKC